MALLSGGLGGAGGFVDTCLSKNSHSLFLHLSCRGKLHCSRVGGKTIACNASARSDDDKNVDSQKRFAIRVPTIPTLADIEAARRLLESAFQSLSFDVPKLPIESAIQGLLLDVSKFAIPKQVFIFDITGFVTTRLKKPAPPESDEVNHEAEADEIDLINPEGASSDEFSTEFPRCAWPRASASVVAGVKQDAKAADLEQQLRNIASAFEISSPALGRASEAPALEQRKKDRPVPHSVVYPHCKWPRETFQASTSSLSQSGSKLAEDLRGKPENLMTEASRAGQLVKKAALLREEASTVVGPHSAWPRRSHQASVTTVLESQAVLYPRSAWPRKSKSAKQTAISPTSGNGVSTAVLEVGNIFSPIENVVSRSTRSGLFVGRESRQAAKENDNVIQGGARCAWPRVTTPVDRVLHNAVAHDGCSNTNHQGESVAPACYWPRQSKLAIGVELSIAGEKSADPMNGINEEIQVKPLVQKSVESFCDLGPKKQFTELENDAAEVMSSAWPRRMLATSVGLSLMNQFLLDQGGFSLASPSYLLLGLLPPARINIPALEESVPDMNRRALMGAAKILLTKH